MTQLPGHTCSGIDAAIRATRKAHRASAALAPMLTEGPMLDALDRWNAAAADLILTLERVRRENAAMRAAVS